MPKVTMDRILDTMAGQPLLPRFLVHLRQRIAAKELTVVIGAGATTDAGAPMWDALLDRIHAAVGTSAGPEPKTYRAMGVHQAVLGTILKTRFATSSDPGDNILKVDNEWFKIIQEAIYRDVPSERDRLFEKHVYLWELIRLCYEVNLVINFNFDDIIAEGMRHYAEVNKHENRPTPSVIWRPALLERKDSALIYHINGVITQGVGKKRSETLVFTEDSFYDAELRSPRVRVDHVLAKFVNTTMFIIGHSLSDNSLKGYLRQSKMINPANHHYFVHWLKDASSLTNDQQREIFEANLELYNLITLFLTTEEVHAFLMAVNAGSSEFQKFLEKTDPNFPRIFYVVGPVAAGKTSVLEYLRCFSTHEEWLGENPRDMFIASEKVDSDRLKRIDDWVYEQIRMKNERLQQAGPGFIFVDRGPLDLFAFSKDDDEWQAKAESVRRTLRGGKLVGGQVVFLNAEAEALVERNWKRGRPPEVSGDATYLRRQGDMLAEVYSEAEPFRTDADPPEAISAQIARAALLGDYAVVDLHTKLEAVAAGGRAGLAS